MDTYNKPVSGNGDRTNEKAQEGIDSQMGPKDVISPNNLFDSYSMGLSKFMIFSTFVAALSSFNAGYNTGVTNIPNDVIRGEDLGDKCYDSSFPLCIYTNNTLMWGFAIGIFALGGCVGSLFSGKISDTVGRRNAMIIGNIPYIIGGLLLATSTTIFQLAAGRFFVGIGSGASSVLVSSYIGEIASVKRRGTLGTILQLMMVVGILSSNIFGLGFSSRPSWRFLLFITAIPAIIQSCILLMCKETPRYLVMKGKLDQARQNLQKFRAGYDIEKEFEDMVQLQQQTGDNKPLSVFGIFKEKKYVKNILVILVVHLIQQFSGINGVITYSTSYFNSIIGVEYSSYSTIALSFLNLVFTLVGVFLIDRTGRKKLLMFSCLGISVCSVAIVIGSVAKLSMLVFVFVMIFIPCFAVGLGPIPWLLMSEMFPTNILSGVSSLSIGINWLSNFIVTMSFLSVKNTLEDYTFLVFAIICTAGFFFILMFLPETKDKTLDQILEN